MVPAALAQLVGHAARQDVSDSKESRAKLCTGVATSAVELLALLTGTPHRRDGCSLQPKQTELLTSLAHALLRMHTLHAAARQAAAVAAQLAPAAAAGASAAAAGPLAALNVDRSTLCTRAGQITSLMLRLVEGLQVLAITQNDRPLTTALLAALRESRLLDHAGRLALLLIEAPGPGAPAAPPATAAPAEVAKFQGHLVFYLTRTASRMGALLTAAQAVPGRVEQLMGCAPEVLMVLGAATLASADLQPYGLPYNPLPKPLAAREWLFPAVCPVALITFGSALLSDIERPNKGCEAPPAPPSRPRVPPRAVFHLVVRLLRLAGASVRASHGLIPDLATETVILDLSWSGDRRTDMATFKSLIPRADAAKVAALAVAALRAAIKRWPRAWAAEARQAWPQLLTGLRHCAELSATDATGAAEALAFLLTHAAVRLVPLPGSPPPVAFSLAQLPPVTAAALAGGVVPLLETLFRCAGDDPFGPEAALAQHILSSQPGRGSIASLLAHSPPRQAAAFIATLAKLLRKTSAGVLLLPNHDVRSTWVELAVAVMTTGVLSWPVEGPSANPPGPVDPSQPCAPLWVLALAALRLLPELSRLTREASRLRLARGPAEGSSGPGQAQPGPGSGAGPTLSAAVGTGAARREALDDVLCMWLDMLQNACAGQLYPGQHCLAGALSLRSLAEEAAAVPLLGALMELAMRPDGQMPASGPKILGYSLVCLVDTCPQQVWACGKTGPGGGTGAEAGFEPGSAWACWRPEALRGLASMLRDTEPAISEILETLAVTLRGPPTSDPGLGRGTGSAATPVDAALAALREQASTVLPACANPACVSLAGDSEAGLKLQQCGRCGRASYCCRNCQTAHWRAGHKAVCGTAVAGGVSEGAGA
ncbi:hypothetical protein HYH03_017183 [Edaphochlamys debaryana]|uniref:phytol kinase n=1 Tax=Edaphochlamys debaryana TaxID=47281 RepID=A0A836BPK2_9CHLO|nr:hypothetical protein HYH03_017183 [Edaphochlamys debaryana]|eukprot:KAG2484017.1 hypothetical protein HYH03_017183 [Edaphochlamys debaryana]